MLVVLLADVTDCDGTFTYIDQHHSLTCMSQSSI